MPYKDPLKAREASRKSNKKWRETHPDYDRKKNPSYGKTYGRRKTDRAAAAHTAVQRAVKDGRLQKPDRCLKCGAFCSLEAAHHDYEAQLDVRWLCRPCHRWEDAHQPKGGQTTEPRQFGFRGPKVTPAHTRARRAAWARMDRKRKREAR